MLSVSFLSNRALKTAYEDSVAFTISTTAKNNAIAMALALSAFGPEVALTHAVAGPLVQLPIMLSYLKLSSGLRA